MPRSGVFATIHEPAGRESSAPSCIIRILRPMPIAFVAGGAVAIRAGAGARGAAAGAGAVRAEGAGLNAAQLSVV